MAGMDGIRMIRASSEEMLVMVAASKRATELRAEERTLLAREIRSEIVEAWNKGQKG